MSDFTRDSTVSVQVFEQFTGLVEQEWLVSVAQTALAGEFSESRHLGIVIADDATVSRLNRAYRGLDGTTDVLSFSPLLWGQYFGSSGEVAWQQESHPFVLPPSEQAGLGELIISYAQAEKQAAVAGHTLAKEIALLLAHGIHHLLGYDHENMTDGKKMRAKESMVMGWIETKGLLD
ncbi:rRNA maturation RNase YbeY [Dehalococcoidia bacterium]|nr:rRNA maturation RNase YbeY [Dehalococcoidia bacterium]